MTSSDPRLKEAWRLRASRIERSREIAEEVLQESSSADASDRAWALLILGLSDARSGRCEHSRVRFAEAALVFERIGDANGLANSLRLSGSVQMLQGNGARAQAEIQEAISIAERHGLEEVAAMARSNVGLVYAQLEERAHAAYNQRRAARAFLRLDLPQLASWSYALAGGHWADAGRVRPARRCLRRSQALRVEDDRILDGMQCTAMATLSIIGEDLHTAIEWLEAADRGFADADDAFSRCDVRLRRGRTMIDAGRDAEAVIALESALLEASNRGYRELEWRLHEALAAAHASLGDYRAAYEAMQMRTRLRSVVHSSASQRGLRHNESQAKREAALLKSTERSARRLEQAYDETIAGWARALDHRDNETHGHSDRVTELTVRLCRKMGADTSQIEHIRRGALLHDIGKIGVPDNILHKPGALDEDEWIVMRRHPVIAYEMLEPIEFLAPALAIPRHHHERWDGTGYPDGLQGTAIPWEARIFAVIDVWDALRSDRPYRIAWSVERTIEHIRSSSGSHFDPDVVDAFLDLIESHEAA